MALTSCVGNPSVASHLAIGGPRITVLKPLAGAKASDYIFISPVGGNLHGPEILSPSGKIIYFHELPPGVTATDFRAQTYLGKPVVTWCQHKLSSPAAVDIMYDASYHKVAEVKAGNGYYADWHEFLITPQDTALITVAKTITANLTSIGGKPDQKVIEDGVQEIDIKTGKVLFQWTTARQVPFGDSQIPLPTSASTPWDWFHVNAVHLDTDGNLLINSRFTWTTYKVDRKTGKIIWQLGGKHSTFEFNAEPGQVFDKAVEIFAFQHDPEPIGHDEYTFFDNESDGGTKLLPHSRVVTVRLDPAIKIATLIKSVNQPEDYVATAEGNAQTIDGGDLFVGWGEVPYVSLFSPSGRLLFNAKLPSGVRHLPGLSPALETLQLAPRPATALARCCCRAGRCLSVSRPATALARCC
ncbi:MAG TPA: arylsulfotransferase family protein [Streptosporangiaceae bacterium]|nr:arylsulfotransferase family protein [Streptosporangiaceae bacterium]